MFIVYVYDFNCIQRMKKILFVFLAFCLFGFSSCERCSTCKVKEGNNTIYTYERECGDKDDLKEYENFCKAQYGQYGYTCECTEE